MLLKPKASIEIVLHYRKKDKERYLNYNAFKTKSKSRKSVALSQKRQSKVPNYNAFKTESSKFHTSNPALKRV